jgi:hypothetical protein
MLLEHFADAQLLYTYRVIDNCTCPEAFTLSTLLRSGFQETVQHLGLSLFVRSIRANFQGPFNVISPC